VAAAVACAPWCRVAQHCTSRYFSAAASNSTAPQCQTSLVLAAGAGSQCHHAERLDSGGCPGSHGHGGHRRGVPGHQAPRGSEPAVHSRCHPRRRRLMVTPGGQRKGSAGVTQGLLVLLQRAGPPEDASSLLLCECSEASCVWFLQLMPPQRGSTNWKAEVQLPTQPCSTRGRNCKWRSAASASTADCRKHRSANMQTLPFVFCGHDAATCSMSSLASRRVSEAGASCSLRCEPFADHRRTPASIRCQKAAPAGSRGQTAPRRCRTRTSASLQQQQVSACTHRLAARRILPT